ncbi:SDR family oxidoreductase [Pseudoprimorskyibacter insulae]|uniref:NAD(P)-binding domain-containing protein n=1 Tax=Pseudoprimorskyibacter insulae TaxID=1695997 RepID=A0A2R8AYR4_9RHOB|nr:SDR family oxidoreductase [Pseudoprimorskyibacter insulae]SPF81185.1 hypothetical protein PRI8871_03007 [Pseudoprimorskyibacter insulae]
MTTVLIAGATGYLGRHLVSEFRQRGCHVRAIVRDTDRARRQGIGAHDLILAEATRPETLEGHFQGVDIVISSLGITRQKDGLSYWDVDYQANVNLLNAALRAGVRQFGYVHVLKARSMQQVPLVAAKQAFVDRLQAAPIASSVIAPSGYFSDMEDFMKMAQSGRVWLFGKGTHRINPVHGADLATAVADTMWNCTPWRNVGGPDIFTHAQLAELAFHVLGKSPKITYLPDALRHAALAALPLLPQSVGGPARFFLTAMGQDMVGDCIGSRRLVDHFRQNQPPQTAALAVL